MKRDFSRQSFLGSESEDAFATVKVGIVGLGGGGSHIVQQLAHIGIQRFVISDPDIVENSNLNRLVGAQSADVGYRITKSKIALRTIVNVNPLADVHCIGDKWHIDSNSLRDCNVIFGCVDSINEREQLERFCRRFMIVYIDVGMDVIKYDEYRIVGQVAQSFPGSACMRCMAIITEHKLKEEAAKYGEAGGRPQVIWANGVLASTAVALFVQLLTSWGQKNEPCYLEYNGNDSILANSPRLQYILQQQCMHYPNEWGDPVFKLPDS